VKADVGSANQRRPCDRKQPFESRGFPNHPAEVVIGGRVLLGRSLMLRCSAKDRRPWSGYSARNSWSSAAGSTSPRTVKLAAPGSSNAAAAASRPGLSVTRSPATSFRTCLLGRLLGTAQGRPEAILQVDHERIEPAGADDLVEMKRLVDQRTFQLHEILIQCRVVAGDRLPLSTVRCTTMSPESHSR
jgi:hypothetical protein